MPSNGLDHYQDGNEINELPAGFFRGGSSFDRVLIQVNPGSDFQLNLELVTKLKPK